MVVTGNRVERRIRSPKFARGPPPVAQTRAGRRATEHRFELRSPSRSTRMSLILWMNHVGCFCVSTGRRASGRSTPRGQHPLPSRPEPRAVDKVARAHRSLRDSGQQERVGPRGAERYEADEASGDLPRPPLRGFCARRRREKRGLACWAAG